MAENKYDITIRQLLKHFDDKPDELGVQWFNSLSADDVNQWIREAMYAMSIGVSEPEVVDEISQQFNVLAETLLQLERERDIGSATFKICGAYITVQVIYPQEEST